MTRMRQHGFRRWFADGSTSSFGHDQGGGEWPAPAQRQCGHRGHVDRITRDRHQPVAPRSIADEAGDGTKAVTEQLTCPGGDAYRQRARAQGRQELAIDAARPFIREVRKEVGNAYQEDETEGNLGGTGPALPHQNSLRRGLEPVRREPSITQKYGRVGPLSGDASRPDDKP